MTSSSFTISPATPADAGRLSVLHNESFARGWPDDAFTDLMASPGVFALLAAEKEHLPLAGFILMRAIAGEAELISIAVAQSSRHRGIASHLLKEAVVFLMAMGTKEIFLEVDTSNLPAQRLYTRFGFNVCGRRPNYYTTPSGLRDALIMHLDLAGCSAGSDSKTTFDRI